MKALVKYFCFSFLMFCFSKSSAQITVTSAPPFNSASYLVQNVLLGTGVVASNFSYIGDSVNTGTQIGFFNATSSNLGIDSGIVLASDDLIDVTPGGFSTGISGIGNENDLLNIANSVPPLIGQSFTVSGIFDKSILEFDFIPSDDTVEFNYVFGSDEYLTYVNTTYNDVFAFLISGPGITGPYAAPAGFPGGAKNIAIVPNSSPALPITISSVNPNINSLYYIDNPLNTTVGLNGFTTVLTAMSPVTPCQTYHIKLAIADGSDGALVSAVFLQAKSFSSGTVTISATPPNVLSGTTGGADTALYEGCGPVIVTLIRAGDLALQDTVLITTSGNAIEGTDYSNIPDTLVFYPGDTMITFSFDPLQDFTTEGLDTLILSVDQTNICFSGNAGTIALSISDAPAVQLTATDTTISCLDNSVSLQVSATGIPPLQYQWSTGVNDTDSVVTVYPVGTTDYFVTVTDGCGLLNAVDTATVTVLADTLVLYTNNETVSCTSTSVNILVQVLAGMQPVTYLWSTGDTTFSTVVSPTVTTDYYVTVTDACGLDSEIAMVNVFVSSLPMQLSVSDTSLFCPSYPVQITATPVGGYAPYTVWWSTGDTTQTIIVSPATTTTYTVSATDMCAPDTVTENITVYVAGHPPLVADAGPDATLNCPGDVILIHPTASGGSGDYTSTWNNWIDYSDSLVVNPLVTTTYIYGVFDNCPTDTVYDSVTVFVPAYDTLKVTVDTTLINSCPDEQVDLVAEATGGDSTYSFVWSNFGGNTDSVSVFPSSTISYTVYVTDECGNTDSQTVNISIVVPQADFEFEYQADNSVKFTNTSLDADSFYWDFGDGGFSVDSNPLYTYASENIYEVTLTAKSEFGCTDSVKKIILPQLQIWVPNAFTPNGDEINDQFEVKGVGIKDFQLKIFDRWGEVIFESDNILKKWDGKTSKGILMRPGTFIYTIKATGLNREKFEKRGIITLVK